MSQLLNTVLFLRNSSKSSNLSSTHRLVLLVLAGRIGNNEDTWITQSVLAKECALQRRRLQYILQDLRDRNLISYGLTGRNNRYKLTLEHAHSSAPIIHDMCTPVHINMCTPVRISSSEKIAASPVVEPKKRPPEKPKEKEKVTIKAKEKEFVLPECINKNDWHDLLMHRREIGKPVKATGRKRLVAHLIKLKDAGQNISEMIDQTISNGWQGIFEVKKKKPSFEQSVPVVTINRYANLPDYTEIRLAKEREDAGIAGNQSRGISMPPAQADISSSLGLGNLLKYDRGSVHGSQSQNAGNLSR